MSKGNKWTKEEEQILRAIYPNGGQYKVRAKLKGARGMRSIVRHALKLGIELTEKGKAATNGPTLDKIAQYKIQSGYSP